jgi:hypothetical protein
LIEYITRFNGEIELCIIPRSNLFFNGNFQRQLRSSTIENGTRLVEDGILENKWLEGTLSHPQVCSAEIKNF